MNIVTKLLFNNRDEDYKLFSKKLIPDTKLEIIGVRMPTLKNIAKTLCKDFTDDMLAFINNYEHKYYEEWMLHGLLLGNIKDYDLLINLLERFLIHVDNWAICDSTAAAIKLLKKYPEKTFKFVQKLLKSPETYIVRFAIVILNNYFLDELFIEECLTNVALVKSDNYYVKMAKAWFFSTALIKQYDKTLPILHDKVLDNFSHNKTIQKAIESFRIENSKKIYLKTLRVSL